MLNSLKLLNAVNHNLLKELNAVNENYEAAQLLLRRNQARSNLLDFTTYTKKNYQVNWHHKLICQKLDQFVAGDIKRLMISLPPRNGKSELVSRRLPAYLLGLDPDTKIIATSYSANLASRMNRDVQRIIESPEYQVLFPNTKLASSKLNFQDHSTQNSGMFEIVGHEGAYISAGIKGSITGSGYDFGIIDDPIKTREEAESDTLRERVWEWYTDVFYTRQENLASILVTQTRWHEDDLAGRLLNLAKEDPSADQWEVITLPAMSEEERPAYDQRPEVDLALWPEKYDVEKLNQIRATVPTYTWLSLYQQRPSAAKGNLFKLENFQYFTESPLTYDLHNEKGTIPVPKGLCIIFQTCDPAGTTKTHSDYFVLSTWAVTQRNDLLLLDVFRTKIEGADHMDFFRTHSKLPNLVLLGFESVGIGMTTFQNLQRERFPVIDLQPKGDKFSRALSAAIRLGSKTTYFRQGAHWLPDWETELLHFPNVKNDDQVDTLSYADFIIVSGLVNRPCEQTYAPPFLGFAVEYSGCSRP
jgi:predicted phage terminase large subunit-like protein